MIPPATPAGLTFRLARAAAFSVVCLGLSVTAHVLAGSSVSASSAAGGLALAFLTALAVSGRERTTAVILPVLVALQVALHLLFSFAHAASPVEMAGHAHSALLPGLGMLVMHGWAVGLTSLWLARGEAALWACCGVSAYGSASCSSCTPIPRTPLSSRHARPSRRSSVRRSCVTP